MTTEEQLKVVAEWMGWGETMLSPLCWRTSAGLLWEGDVKADKPKVYGHLLPVWHKLRPLLQEVARRWGMKVSSRARCLYDETVRAFMECTPAEALNALAEAIQWIQSLKPQTSEA